jgi:hypothetical protein
MKAPKVKLVSDGFFKPLHPNIVNNSKETQFNASRQGIIQYEYFSSSILPNFKPSLKRPTYSIKKGLK